jgi:DNA-binding SARP family transcriptional activator/TolB-like protein/Flp pilus assembly protein TadD
MIKAEFLSGFRICDPAGNPVQMPVRKARALFAFLAINSERLFARDRLADLLWNATSDRHARQSLRRCLLDLRCALGAAPEEVLRVDGDKLGLVRGAVGVDVLTFRALVAAGNYAAAVGLLSNGDLFDGLEIGTERFDEWLAQERRCHREMAAGALLANAEHLVGADLLEPAVVSAQQCLAYDPCCEEAHGLLIDAYLRLNRPDLARRQNAHRIDMLRHGLGVEPAGSTTATGVPVANWASPEKSRRPVVRIRRLLALGPDRVEAARAFSDGLLEDILGEISRYRWVSPTPVDNCGDYAIGGSVRLSGGRFRVSLRLTQEDGTLLWSETFDGSVSDFLTPQNRIAALSVSRMMTQIERRERTESHSESGGRCAYALWQRGMEHFFNYTREGNAQAKRLYLEAIKLDTEFAPAYVAMSYAEQLDAFFNYSGTRRACLERALSTARAAVTMDPSDARARTALGTVLTRVADMDEAAAELETARLLCPTLSEAHYASGLALYYSAMPAQALSCFQRSIELDPTSPRIWGMRHMMARCFYDLGQFGDALRWAHRAVIAPNAKSIAVALEAGAARKLGHEQVARRLVGDLLRQDPTMTATYLVENLGNERINDHVIDLAETLSKCGLPR